MKLLYGTGNQAKLSAMKHRLNNLNIEVIGLKELQAEIPAVLEDGQTPLENARQKALAYYNAFHIPVFSCDSGLYLEGVTEEEQPGIHVRTINGKCLTDEEMLAHYTGLVEKYGDMTAKYKNAICLVMDEEHIYEAMEPSMESETFIITSKPHSKVRKKGFPLDSLSVHIKTGKYYYDLAPEELEQVAVEDGFLEFFGKIFGGRIALSATLNTRSILPGSMRYVRSDVPVSLSDADKNWLLENNLLTIVDLREEAEHEKKPCPLASMKEFVYYSTPVTGGNAIPKSPEFVPDSYLKMVDSQMTKIIALIENAGSNVFYFCNAGKDRTGVVSAILLKRMGMSDEYIVSDYVKSEKNLREMLEAYAKSNPDVDINVITPKAEYMEKFLKEFPNRTCFCDTEK